MYKYIATAIGVILISCAAFAQIMDDQSFTLTTTHTNQVTASKVLRGTLKAVYLDVAANTTNRFSLIDAHGQTLFDMSSITADGIYYPTFKRQTYAGVQIGDLVADGYTNFVYDCFAIASKVTARFYPAAGAATSSVTQTMTVIYDQ